MPDEGTSFIEQAAVLRGPLGRLELREFDLVVHDWGGPVSLGALADDLARVRRLVLLNTTIRHDFTPPEHWEPFIAEGSGEELLIEQNAWCAGLSTAMSAAADPEIHEHYLKPSERIGTRRTILRMERLEGFAQLLAPIPDALSHFPPTHIIWGDDDIYFGDEYRRLVEIVPSATVTMIPDGGHFPQEDAPDAVTAAISSLLSDSGPPR